jgi:molybdate transport system substrate-binding protein
MLRKVAIIAMTVFLVMASSACSGKSGTTQNAEIVVSAASSLRDALTDIAAKYEADHPGVHVSLNFGSSGALRQQIENGAPADMFFSADRKNMDELNGKGLLVENTVTDVLGNRIVLASADRSLKSISLDDLISKKVGSIAIGEPATVPAGKYASETFDNLGIMEKAKDKVVYGKDANEVMAWVESGNADVGIVYESDLKASKTAFKVMDIDDRLHSEIVYPAAVVKASKNPDGAVDFLKVISSEESLSTFEKYGFTSAK